MDRGKKPNKFIVSTNNRIYMDLKDVIREHALPFLPAKSLSRFQGVCRDWKLQISTPLFAHNQSLSFHAFSGLFCQSPGDPPSFFSIDPESYGVPDPSLKFWPDPVDIRASSNGLLCCQGWRDRAYYICNPVTKLWKKLPEPNGDHGSNLAVVLVFEPSLLNFVAEYKLICAFPSADFDNASEFEIYSSIEGCWKISGEICFADRKLLPRSGVHVNGVVYCNARTWVEKDRFHLDNTVLREVAVDQAEVVYAGDNLVVVQSGGKIFYCDMKTKKTAFLCNAADFATRCVPYVNSLVYI
ncbi:hypothetical protein F0562_003789 [Nyssa sinensis]|uniref:F-box protein At3g26010-like beta-propeller domain-containing protein n=1 Tax=Nyssa sinensis TaxID=561372 RepID=A0A5J5C0A2_9ASTE|nr:hypothetical protein F0562_003789 [Nyssa sinensis]